jgi:hypothetical protein
MSFQLGNYHRTGNTANPKVVVPGDNGTYEAPENRVIVMIVPDPTWSGSATTHAHYATELNFTSDGTTSGSAISNVMVPIAGKYQSVTVTSGRAIVYLNGTD